MKSSYSGTGMTPLRQAQGERVNSGPNTVFSAAARRFWIAEQAGSCATWLKAQGLEVLRVEKSPHTPPRIVIRPSPLCDSFDGAVAFYSRATNHSRTVQAEQRYKMVMRFGCEVRWEDAT